VSRYTGRMMPCTHLLAWPRPLQEFVTEYFDQNPISALGLIVARRGSAEKVSDLSPNRDRHLRAIAAHCAHTEGDFSLQTALEIALKQLQLIPTYGTREVLLVHGAHASVDPGNILTTIAELQKHRVTVSCVSLPGEVYIATRVVRETGGRYSVPESYDALRQQVLGHCVPPPRKRSLGPGTAAGGDAAKMVAMGFPRMVWESAGLCACHGEVKPNGYVCPRCSSRICDLPATCAVCSLQLISAARLARSYHHLFPVLPFVEVPGANEPAIVPPQHMPRYLPHSGDAAEDGGGSAAAALSALSISSVAAPTGAAKRPRLAGSVDGSTATDDGAALLPSDAAAHQQGYLVHDESKHCSGCTAPLAAAAARFVCMSCRSAFCGSCDALVHETLHNCPGCC